MNSLHPRLQLCLQNKIKSVGLPPLKYQYIPRKLRVEYFGTRFSAFVQVFVHITKEKKRRLVVDSLEDIFRFKFFTNKSLKSP